MKKSILFGLILTVICGLNLFSQEQGPVIKDIEGFWIAGMDFGGSYAKIPAAIQTYVGEFLKQGLTPSGALVGIYYNDPTVTKEEDLKWGVGFIVPADVTVKEPLLKKEIKTAKAVYYLYKGPYGQMEAAYVSLMKYIDEQGYKMVMPSFEKYLDDPQQVKPEDLRTEIILPVEKK